MIIEDEDFKLLPPKQNRTVFDTVIDFVIIAREKLKKKNNDELTNMVVKNKADEEDEVDREPTVIDERRKSASEETRFESCLRRVDNGESPSPRAPRTDSEMGLSDESEKEQSDNKKIIEVNKQLMNSCTQKNKRGRYVKASRERRFDQSLFLESSVFVTEESIKEEDRAHKGNETTYITLEVHEFCYEDESEWERMVKKEPKRERSFHENDFEELPSKEMAEEEPKYKRSNNGIVTKEPTNMAASKTRRRSKRSQAPGQSKKHKTKSKGQMQKTMIDLTSTEFPMELPAEIKTIVEEMGGTDLMVVAKKAFTHTDLNPNHNRLSIPRRYISKRDFLSPEEMNLLTTEQKNSGDSLSERKPEVPVIVIDPSGNMFEEMKLRRWEMNKKVFVLVTKWNDIVNANDFEVGEVIQLWTFRSGSRRCFAIQVVKKANENQSEESSTARTENRGACAAGGPNEDEKNCVGETKEDTKTDEEAEKLGSGDDGASTSGKKS